MSDEPILKFWMVYGLERGQPTYKHPTKEAAQAEAKRLASLYPGELFTVLAAVDAFKAQIAPAETVRLRKPTRAELMDLEIPF